jgi:hypothetical protein
MTDEPDEATPVFMMTDDDMLMNAVREVIAGTFGIELVQVPGEAWGVEADLGTLFVGTVSDYIVSMELRLPGEFDETTALLQYLNERNAATTFVTFSILDECVWLSGNVDGHPFAPEHVVRVLDFIFQAASAVITDLDAEA